MCAHWQRAKGWIASYSVLSEQRDGFCAGHLDTVRSLRAVLGRGVKRTNTRTQHWITGYRKSCKSNMSMGELRYFAQGVCCAVCETITVHGDLDEHRHEIHVLSMWRNSMQHELLALHNTVCELKVSAQEHNIVGDEAEHGWPGAVCKHCAWEEEGTAVCKNKPMGETLSHQHTTHATSRQRCTRTLSCGWDIPVPLSNPSHRRKSHPNSRQHQHYMCERRVREKWKPFLNDRSL